MVFRLRLGLGHGLVWLELGKEVGHWFMYIEVSTKLEIGVCVCVCYSLMLQSLVLKLGPRGLPSNQVSDLPVSCLVGLKTWLKDNPRPNS